MDEPAAALPTQSAPGRYGPLFAAVWLFFLIDPIVEGWSRHDARGWAGVLVTVAFAALYMSLWLRSRRDRHRLVEVAPLRIAVLELLGLAALGVAMIALLGEVGLTSVVYVGVAAVILLPFRAAVPVVAVLGAVTIGLGAVEGWGSQLGIAFGLLAAAVAVFGLRMVMDRNVELVRAQQTNAALAVENERTRFARDLHDILGHSLTVITVKAELAGKLLDAHDPDVADRARAEVADLERLSRDALADVRRAVEGYREITLPGEIARARVALGAAEIEASLPNSTDEVPSDLRDLYAWTVREGVTNVIRHSGARRCTIRLTAGSAEVIDDGSGPVGDRDGDGSGLVGLRERAAAVGATVTTRVLDPGFELQVGRP